MTGTDADARQVRKHSPDVGLHAKPRDRLRLTAAVCPGASWTEEPSKRRAVNQITHPFERPRMRIATAAPAPHRALVALSKSVELDSTLRELVNLRASIVNGCPLHRHAHQGGASSRRK